jgi:predicted dehydrogenase
VTRVRILVIGAGHMGRLHASKIAAHGGCVELAGVADRHLDRAQAVAAPHGVPAVADFRELAGTAEAAVAAVPTVAHFAVVRELLALGLDVLVEKPIAARIEEAEALIELACAGGRVLQVGHLEWYNPALRAVLPAIRAPRFVEARRLGPFPGRATDVDIVRDLMIHDLDVVQRLLGEEPETVEGIGVPVVSGELDLANARLRFPGGCVAELTASRVSPTPERTLRLFQEDGYVSVDFLAGAATIRRRRVDGEGRTHLAAEPVCGGGGDALGAQLRAFATAVVSRRDASGSALAGLRALRTALRVVASMPAAGGTR